MCHYLFNEIHRCVMDSLVNPVVANLCMEEIEHLAPRKTPTKPKTWKRFVDDNFSIIKRTTISTFQDTLNDIDPNIKFTIVHEENNKISKQQFFAFYFRHYVLIHTCVM